MPRHPNNGPPIDSSIRAGRTNRTMDELDRMRLFVRVVERRNFTAAAADLGLPRSTATEAIKQLEDHLGTRLLDRTTRHVATTLDGQAYYERCLSILGEVEDAEAGFRSTEPRGLLRIDAHPLLTQKFLLPELPAFLERYPQIDLHIGQGDRLVDLVSRRCRLRHPRGRTAGQRHDHATAGDDRRNHLRQPGLSDAPWDARRGPTRWRATRPSASSPRAQAKSCRWSSRSAQGWIGSRCRAG